VSLHLAVTQIRHAPEPRQPTRTQPGTATSRAVQTPPAPEPTSRPDNPAAGAGTVRIRVQRGDTLWNLARKYLGHGRNWTLLVATNPQLAVPTRLQIGAWVRLLLPVDGPDFGSGERVRVQAGDSLWKLSQVHFGDGRAWGCIARANPELRNANLIFSGQTVAIPGSCTVADAHMRASAVSAEALPTSTAQLPSPVN